MAVIEHKLFKELFETVWFWAKTHVEKTYDSKHFKLPFPRGAGIKLSPKQVYEYNCYYWCRRLDDIFDRLKAIQTMTGRSLYKKKNEVKSVLMQEWIMYNYEQYTIVYQGILDVALLLTNEILELGTPYTKCTYNTIFENTRVNGTSVHRVLKKLNNTTTKHREGKNFFVHRGERIELPIDKKIYDAIDVTNMAIKLGLEIGYTKELLEEFLEIHTRKQIIQIMEKECKIIEPQIEELLTELLPYYHTFHSLYL